MAKRVSIKDIAAAAGVSHSTVSRALHQRGRMSKETRAHILKLAADMEYTPDAQARSLVMGKTHTIGVVVTTIADPFVSEIVSGIEQAAQDAGYSVFLSSSHADPERELTVVNTFRQRRVDAIIVTASQLGQHYSTDLDDFHVPVVLINNQGEGDYLYSVATDEIDGARQATQYLLQAGHRRIGYIGSPRRPYSTQRRYQGYLQALATAQLSAHPALFITPTAATDVEVGQAGLRALWPARPTAILAYNDMTAIGVMMAAREHGLQIPSQLSVVGFDDVALTEFVTPALTTVRQPREAMGYAAMEMILQLLAGEAVADRLFPCELVVRQSMQPCRM
ncbi:MAG: LacI family transcriptional regulator [Chloroflexi bacterium]|nr:LacI family transcriptional regulator [Chloroflexota bacterium]